MKNLPSSQSGQALLIILLIAAVSLTIGLSITSRSITDIRISQRTEDAARAYSAAEAGIEEALATGVIGNNYTYTFNETGAKFNSQVTGIGGGSDEFAFPQPIGSTETQTLSLASWDNDTKIYSKSWAGTSLQIFWGNKDTADTPGLEVNIYYKDASNNPKNIRFMLDPSSSRSPDPHFCNLGEGGGSGDCVYVTAPPSQGTYAISGQEFRYSATLNTLGAGMGATTTPLFARLRLLFTSQSHIVGAKGVGGNFPSQGTKVVSTGQSGDSTRSVEVTQFNPVPPELFDFVMYSGSDLSK